eukprot:8644436-Heterocapsa_arctica.AAC.1
MQDLCGGHWYLMCQAGARSAGMVTQAGLGLLRGIYNLLPPPEGSSGEIALELASSQNHDGTESGRYRPMKNNGRDYGKIYGQV